MPNSIYFLGALENKNSLSCMVDLTPPTFAGITSATPNTDGTITASWVAATDASPPLNYLLYIAVGSVSAASLFVVGNLVSLAPNAATSQKVMTLADQTTYLVNGQIYTVGVRCKDGVGNVNTNTAILTTTAIASGNLPAVYQTIATNLAATEVLLSGDHTNFAADHVNFQSDHTNFVTDHTNFQTDHTNFLADHTNFQSDHTNFVTQIGLLTTQVSNITSSATSLSSSATSLASTATAIAATEVLLAADVASMTTQVGLLTTQVSNITTTATNLASTASSFSTTQSAFASTQSTFSTNVASMTTQVGLLTTQVSAITATALSLSATSLALAITETALQTDVANLQSEVMTLNTYLATFSAELVQLQGLINALAISVSAAGSLNGIALEVVPSSDIDMEIIDETEVQ